VDGTIISDMSVTLPMAALSRLTSLFTSWGGSGAGVGTEWVISKRPQATESRNTNSVAQKQSPSFISLPDSAVIRGKRDITFICGPNDGLGVMI
jgi:hypothetical protein